MSPLSIRSSVLVALAPLLLCVAATPLAAQSAPARAWVEETNVKIPMADGVRLAADVFLPDRDGTFPTVLVRTPYDKRGKRWLAEGLVASGYAVVLEDVRGLGASEGEFMPVVNEKRDGLATLDWIAARPWCDGRIGMWGTSYVAFCALVVVPERHPALAAIVNMSGFGDTADFIYPGGAMHLMLALTWSLSNQIRGQGSFQDYDWPELFSELPVAEIPSTIGIANDVFVPMVTSIEHPLLREEGSILSALDRFGVPALHVTGWNDFVARDTVSVFEGIREAASTAGASAEQRLMIGPWRHDQVWGQGTVVGDTDFGPAARMGLEAVVELVVGWFDRHLKAERAEPDGAQPVQLFVMGANEWRGFDAWPPRDAEVQQWHFLSEHGANGLAGDGRLTTEAPAEEAEDTFLFDPLDPVPTAGGANFHFFLDLVGPRDQREVEARDDVLVYTSAPLESPIDVIGPVRAVVYAASEGRSTDFTAKLVVVEPDGYARIVTDGVKRGPDRPEEDGGMAPGETYRFTIDLGDTAVRVAAGQRLRVEISSSNFPKYTRNPNTGERAEYATEFLEVAQSVRLGGARASHVALPVLAVGQEGAGSPARGD